MAARKPGLGVRGMRAEARMPSTAIVVDDEQRRRLAEDCAFFRAARPGQYRKEDLRDAAAAIDAAIEPRRKWKTPR